MGLTPSRHEIPRHEHDDEMQSIYMYVGDRAISDSQFVNFAATDVCNNQSFSFRWEFFYAILVLIYFEINRINSQSVLSVLHILPPSVTDVTTTLTQHWLSASCCGCCCVVRCCCIVGPLYATLLQY